MEGYDPNLVRENSKWVVYYLERGAYDGVVFLTAKERRAVTSLNPLQSSSRDGNSRIYGCEKGEREWTVLRKPLKC